MKGDFFLVFHDYSSLDEVTQISNKSFYPDKSAKRDE